MLSGFRETVLRYPYWQMQPTKTFDPCPLLNRVRARLHDLSGQWKFRDKNFGESIMLNVSSRDHQTCGCIGPCLAQDTNWLAVCPLCKGDYQLTP